MRAVVIGYLRSTINQTMHEICQHDIIDMAQLIISSMFSRTGVSSKILFRDNRLQSLPIFKNSLKSLISDISSNDFGLEQLFIQITRCDSKNLCRAYQNRENRLQTRASVREIFFEQNISSTPLTPLREIKIRISRYYTSSHTSLRETKNEIWHTIRHFVRQKM